MRRVARGPNRAERIVTREGGGWRGQKGHVAPEVTVTVVGMDPSMSKTTRHEELTKLRRRYQNAGLEHKGTLLDQAQEVLGYHRKAAVRALRACPVEPGPRILTGRPLTYEPGRLMPWLRSIWQATDYASRGGRRSRSARSGEGPKRPRQAVAPVAQNRATR